jgi:hypothetical protein
VRYQAALHPGTLAYVTLSEANETLAYERPELRIAYLRRHSNGGWKRCELLPQTPLSYFLRRFSRTRTETSMGVPSKPNSSRRRRSMKRR